MKQLEIVKDILSKKSGGRLHMVEDFQVVRPMYVVTRYLSSLDELVPYCEILNRLNGILPEADLYQLAYNMIPKYKKVPYLTYPARPKKEIPNDTEADLDEDLVGEDVQDDECDPESEEPQSIRRDGRVRPQE
jgi:hypothetical protein